MHRPSHSLLLTEQGLSYLCVTGEYREHYFIQGNNVQRNEPATAAAGCNTGSFTFALSCFFQAWLPALRWGDCYLHA